MDRSDIENEKSNINELREAAEAARDAAQRLDEVVQELAGHLKRLSVSAGHCESLDLFELDAMEIRDVVSKGAPAEGVGSQLIAKLEAMLEKTDDYEDELDNQLDEDE